jgi:hypothetical protein
MPHDERAWDDPTKPIAPAFGHFMLQATRRTGSPVVPSPPTRDLMPKQPSRVNCVRGLLGDSF